MVVQQLLIYTGSNAWESGSLKPCLLSGEIHLCAMELKHDLPPFQCFHESPLQRDKLEATLHKRICEAAWVVSFLQLLLWFQVQHCCQVVFVALCSCYFMKGTEQHGLILFLFTPSYCCYFRERLIRLLANHQKQFNKDGQKTEVQVYQML